jgi:hypothetical protein
MPHRLDRSYGMQLRMPGPSPKPTTQKPNLTWKRTLEPELELEHMQTQTCTPLELHSVTR